MNQDHEEIIKNLKDKEKSKDEYNTLDTDIIEYEIRNTALKLKLRKAVYSYKISNEMIKSSTDILSEGFIKLFNKIINTGIFPQSWCEGLITPILKSRSK